jgi:hypothetical protein
VVIHDLHFVRVAIFEFKTKTILVINSDTVLPVALAFQSLQVVSRRRGQVTELARVLKKKQLTPGYAAKIRGNTFALSRQIKPLRLRIGETLDHKSA